MFLGKTVHAGLELLNRHRQICVELSPEDVVTRMIDDWGEAVEAESMQFASTEEEGVLKKQAVDLVAAYMEHTVDAQERPLAVETSMEAPLIDPDNGEDLGIPLMGIVDLVTGSRDGPSVIDFKTSARSSPPHESHTRDPALQLRLFVQAGYGGGRRRAGDPISDQDQNAQGRDPCLSIQERYAPSSVVRCNPSLPGRS